MEISRAYEHRAQYRRLRKGGASAVQPEKRLSEAEKSVCRANALIEQVTRKNRVQLRRFAFRLGKRKIQNDSLHLAFGFFPSTISAVCLGLIWSMIYHNKYGILNWFLEAIGREDLCQVWLNNTDIVMLERETFTLGEAIATARYQYN